MTDMSQPYCQDNERHREGKHTRDAMKNQTFHCRFIQLSPSQKDFAKRTVFAWKPETVFHLILKEMNEYINSLLSLS